MAAGDVGRGGCDVDRLNEQRATGQLGRIRTEGMMGIVLQGVAGDTPRLRRNA